MPIDETMAVKLKSQNQITNVHGWSKACHINQEYW